MVSVDELQRSTARVGEAVDRLAITHVLHGSGLYGKTGRRQPGVLVKYNLVKLLGQHGSAL